MPDIRFKDLTEAATPGPDYWVPTDSATDGVKKIKPSNLVSKADLGLGNVDNTSDANKPVSTAMQTALNGKATSTQGAKADSAVQPGDLGALAVKNKVAIADISTAGTADSAHYLRGDGVWGVPAGGGDMLAASNLSDLADRKQAHTNIGARAIDARLFGAVGDGITLNNTALNAALAFSAANGVPVFLPGGTYLIDAPYSKTQLGATRYYGLNFLSGMSLIGVTGYTVIKIKNNISSNTIPKDVNVFVCDDAQSDISIYGVEFDLNGQNNLINGGFRHGGAIDITGNSAYVKRLYIEKCTFRNGAGTNVIVLGQQTTSGPLSADVRIIDCRFIDNGRDTSDFTAVYAWGERVRVEGCLFVQSDTLPRTGKNWVAMELHGSENYFVRSKVLNYARACWCAPNYTRDARGQYVLDNVFDVWAYGPSLFSDRSTTGAVTDVFIERNVIILRADEPSVAKQGVNVLTNYGVSNVFIRHNTIIADGVGYDSKGCLVGVTGVSGQITRNVFFEHNLVKGAVAGLYVRVNNGDGVLDEIHDRFNTYEDIGGSNGTPTSFGSLFAQAGTSEILKVSSCGNRYIGSSGFDNGVYAVGTISDAYFSENIFDGVTTPLNLGSATITRARGKQAMAASYATADRPTYLSAQDRGLDIYDSTLGKVIRWSGSGWLT